MGGRFPQDFIEAVRNAADIVRVVSEYVPLKQAGVRMKGLCPFHQEKTPSFSVDPSAQLFYCFGCQTGGDVFKFFTLYEKVDFPEAVETLAKRFGVPVPKTVAEPRGPRDRIAEMNGSAEAFFRGLLRDADGGRSCRGYIDQRGLSAETVERLRLGYAPDTWEALRLHLLKKGFAPSELLRAGLVLPRKSGSGQYDRFRNRLIFPIRDINGRTVAFGGRAIGDAEPKYLNSPETPTYTKGDHLYGLDLARGSIRELGFAIVVEGYLDVALVTQAGFTNVVASLGTAFTPQQARLLARFTEDVVVSYDGDAAGATAVSRSLGLLLQKGFRVRVVDLPDGEDPDDYIRREGAEAYGRLVEAAPEYLQYLIMRETRARDTSRLEGKIAAVNAVLPHLARLGNSIERASWVSRLADALQIEDALVMQELRAAAKSAQTRIHHRPKASHGLRQAEARLVSLLLRSQDERHRCVDGFDPTDLEGCAVSSIVSAILRLEREGQTVDFPSVLASLESDADRSLLNRIAFRDEPDTGPTVEDCLWAFKHQKLKKQEREVVREIGKLQGDLDEAEAEDVNQQLTRLQELARQRDALHG